MRHLLAAVVVLTLLVCSQSLAQTTLEEYNYITKGYKIQTESGLDMKQGYKLVDLTESSLVMSGDSTSRKTVFKALYRGDESTPCAMMCIYSYLSAGTVMSSDYLCIPQTESSKEIWGMVYNKIAEYKGEASNALTLGLMHLASHYSKKE